MRVKTPISTEKAEILINSLETDFINHEFANDKEVESQMESDILC